ncbi:unnamed protein product [Diatraea saccharalis]|uniref:Uncharacterized protein n=1 Tax=Diatraea saccharalis TaxID=40085 RepID=A0A9N9WIB9_9NEOP|nr:unnamed protein product [Diatraea saccharalis]
MTSSTFFLVCLQALLIQNAFSQLVQPLVNYGNFLGDTGTDLNLIAASNAVGGINGYLGNGGLINNAIDVNTIGYNGVGLGNSLSGLNNAGLGVVGLGYGSGLGVQNVAATSQVPVTGPFTATGNAELVVGGDFDVIGQTAIGGQIPVIGSVTFSGQVPASGVVSVAGNCGCSNVPL